MGPAFGPAPFASRMGDTPAVRRRLAATTLALALLAAACTPAGTTTTTADPAAAIDQCLVDVAAELCPMLWRFQLDVGRIANQMSSSTLDEPDPEVRQAAFATALDGIRARLTEDPDRASDSLRKAHMLFSLLAPMGAFLVGFPEAAERIRAGLATRMQPRPDAAPLLVGRNESAGFMLFVIGLVVAIGALVAALAPAQAARVEVNASIGAQPEFSTAGAEGREVYLREGCASCHTMMVRSVVTDAGLGPVTRVQDVAPLAPDTLGMRRIGPDLAHIGSRNGTTLGTVIAFLEDPASVSLSLLHQPYGYLSDTELASLAQFIVETG